MRRLFALLIFALLFLHPSKTYATPGDITDEEYATFFKYIESGRWTEVKSFFTNDSLLRDFSRYFSKSRKYTDSDQDFYSWKLTNHKRGEAIFKSESTRQVLSVKINLKVEKVFCMIRDFEVKEIGKEKSIPNDTARFRYIVLPFAGFNSISHTNSFSSTYRNYYRSHTGPKIIMNRLDPATFQNNPLKCFNNIDPRYDTIPPQTGDCLPRGETYSPEAYKTYVKMASKKEHNKANTLIFAQSHDNTLLIVRENMPIVNYGNKKGETRFKEITSLTYLGNFLYVLDRKELSGTIYIYSLTSGKSNNALNLVDSIVVEGNTFSFYGKHLCGYELPGTSELNKLLLITSFETIILPINKITGKIAGNAVKTNDFRIRDKPNYSTFRSDDIQNISIRSPENKADRGTVMVLSERRIFSFPLTEIEKQGPGIIEVSEPFNISYNSDLNSVLYSSAEQSWFVTGFSYLFKFDKYLRFNYSGSLSQYSFNEYISFPPFENPFEYPVYLSISRRPRREGISYYTPALNVTDIIGFEESKTGKLFFPINLSGKWAETKDIKAVQLKGFTLNGHELNTNIWKDQLTSKLLNKPGDEFLNYSSVLEINPENIIDQSNKKIVLTRGFNILQTTFYTYSDTQGNSLLDTLIGTCSFYWLPSHFKPEKSSNLHDILLENIKDTLPHTTQIYKPVTIEEKGLFRSSSTMIYKGASLRIAKGATFLNQSPASYVFQNFQLKGHLIIDSGSYICLSNDPSQNYIIEKTTDYDPWIRLNRGWKRGFNPSISSILPKKMVKSCLSSCNFKNSFGDYFRPNQMVRGWISNEEPTILLLGPKSRYEFDRLKIKIEDIDTNGKRIVSDSLVLAREKIQDTMDLGKKGGEKWKIKIQHCHRYKISLLLNCKEDPSEWVKMFDTEVDFHPSVFVWQDINYGDKEHVVIKVQPASVPGDGSYGRLTLPEGVILDNLNRINLKNYPQKLSNVPQAFRYTYIDKTGCKSSVTEMLSIPAAP